MRSLTVKLTIAFLIVGLTGAALAAVFARWATSREFGRLVSDQAQSSFITDVSTYYQAHGTWDGVANGISPRRPPPVAPRPQPRDENPPQPQPDPAQPPFSFVLVDRQGKVVVPGGAYRVGDRVPTAQLEQGAPVEVGGQIVGITLTTGRPLALDPKEQQYVARTDQALLLAALISIAVALILGTVLARTLARPLRELTAATRAMAKGQLGQQVSIRSQDELGELAASFNQMSADLALANEQRRQMTADIAHELRTPLTVITGYIEALRDGVLKPNADRFEAMYREAQQLKRLIEDLRTLSLAEAGELPLTRQPISPQVLLERLASTFVHPAGQHNLSLKVTADRDVPEVNVDPERLMQVLENLVSNALRHTPAGGEIILSARAEAGAVLLIVQDNGEGIAPDVLPHIFDRFYRGDASRSEQSGESGLGLAIARSIVKAHGGTITASSQGAGKGSTFTVRLPCTRATEPPVSI
jgi:two-component system sensor histidine kinase BaeS